MRNLNRRLARVPVWAASLLLVLSVLTWGGIASAQLSWANETVEAAKAQATSARTETAHVKAELVRKERALAEANARLRQVGEKPVDPDKCDGAAGGGAFGDGRGLRGGVETESWSMRTMPAGR